MTTRIIRMLIFPLLAAALSCRPAVAQTCGGPMARKLLDGFALGLRHELTPETEYAMLRTASRARLEQLNLALSPLSRDEAALAVKMSVMKPYLVTRIGFKNLRAVLKSGSLLSPRALEAMGKAGDKPYTPKLEDELFGGYSCVFASLGPYNGRERYGEVAFRLKNGVGRRAWASFSSGYHYISAVRKKDASSGYSPSGDDVRGFIDTVFSGDDWSEAYPLMLVAYLRGKPGRAEIIKKLLAAPDGRAFYEIVDGERIGYLEVKIPDSVSLEDVERIEVPAGRLWEALAWEEVERYRGKIFGSDFVR
jgi:hypothetical protein